MTSSGIRTGRKQIIVGPHKPNSASAAESSTHFDGIHWEFRAATLISATVRGFAI